MNAQDEIDRTAPPLPIVHLEPIDTSAVHDPDGARLGGVISGDEPTIRLADIALPLCLVDPGGTILWANASFWALVRTNGDLAHAGTRLDALIDPADRHHLTASMAQPAEVRFADVGGAGRRYELRAVAHGVAQTPGAWPPLLLTALDTEDWRAEAELEAALRLEIGHRLRNLVTVVTALVNDTMRRQSDGTAVDRLLDRLRSLQTAGYVGNEVFDADCSVDRIARRILDRFHDPADRRVMLEGEDVALSRRWGNTLALIFHELATNSIKHGALSVRAGMVMMRWCTIAQPERTMLHIEWRDVGGPVVHQPARLGQGLTFVENILGRAKEATIAFRFAPTGFVCQLDMPIQHRNR